MAKTSTYADAGPRQLAALLRARRSEIVAAWQSKVRKNGRARLDGTTLEGGISELVDDLADAAERLARVDRDELEPRFRTFDRLREGFDLSEVLSELALLREAIIEAWAAETPPPPAGLQDWRTLHGALDAAIDTAVRRYATLEAAAAEARRSALEESQARQREAEKALRASEGRFHLFLDHMPSIVYLRDPEGRFLYCNQTTADILGLESAQIIGRKDRELFPVSIAEEFLRNDQAVRRAGRALTFEEHADFGEGERTYLTIKFPVWMPDRTFLGVGGISTDITERKRIEEDLRLLAEAGDVLSGPAEAKVLVPAVSRLLVPAFARWCWFRIEPAESGAGYTAVAHTDPALEPGLAALGDDSPVTLREGEASLFIPRVGPADAGDLVPDPARRALLEAAGLRSLIAVPLMVQDERVGLCVLARGPDDPPFDARDQRVAAELGRRGALVIENARLLEKAQHAVRLREDVLTMVSHDLKSPLSAILLGTSALERAEHDPLTRRQIASIRHAAGRMDALIRDLLDMARLRAERMTLDLGTHDLCGLVHDALEIHRPIAAEAGVEIAHPEGLPPIPVNCDRERILQVLSNLLGNAIKFSRPGDRVRLDAAIEDGEVHVMVSDSGPGIPPELRSRIFTAWSSGAPSDRRERSTGLGLFIARGIVEAHGGRIWVESAVGQGSVFHFTIPRAA